jgi:hypothetical protein
MREVVHPKPTKKARPAMTAAAKANDGAKADDAEPIGLKERRDALIAQAEEKEAAHDEAYDKLVAENKEFAARMEKAQDPEERDKADAAAAKKANPKYIQSPTTADFKQGQAAG